MDGGRCHGCGMLVLLWQVTSGKNLRRIDGVCADITEAERRKLTGWFIIRLQHVGKCIQECCKMIELD